MKRNFTILSITPLAIITVAFVLMFGSLFEQSPHKQLVSSSNLREYIPASQLVRETYTTCMEKRLASDHKGCVLVVRQLADASAKYRNQSDFPQQVNAAMIDMGLLEKSSLQATNF